MQQVRLRRGAEPTCQATAGHVTARSTPTTPLIGLTAAARGLRLGLTAVAAAGVLLLLGSPLLPVTARVSRD